MRIGSSPNNPPVKIVISPTMFHRFSDLFPIRVSRSNRLPPPSILKGMFFLQQSRIQTVFRQIYIKFSGGKRNLGARGTGIGYSDPRVPRPERSKIPSSSSHPKILLISFTETPSQPVKNLSTLLTTNYHISKALHTRYSLKF